MENRQNPLRDLRARLRPRLPEKAFLRRDRGEGLFITNAPAFDPSLCQIPGFILEIQGTLMRIFPDEEYIRRMEQTQFAPPDHLSASLARFRGERADRANLLLFVQAAKLLDDDYTAPESEIDACDRALRNRCAQALRGAACGGGLYATALLMNRAKHYNKGEKQP